MHIPSVLQRQPQRCPMPLLDAAAPTDEPGRLVGVKAVSASEDYFRGHFPGTPIMPGVLMIEAVTQAAVALLAHEPGVAEGTTIRLRGVDAAKFRRHVAPGDRLELDVRIVRRRGPLARVAALATVEGAVALEATLLLVVESGAPVIHPTAVVHPSAVIGAGTSIGPGAVIGPHVVLGRDVVVMANAVVDGDTTIGDRTQIFPFGSVGLAPQDLKYRGERTRLVVGTDNVFRESVTIHRGTVGGGGETRIGDHNLFMAYVHVAHDCRVGSGTVFGPGATLGGHVEVADFAQISAYSGVHQFCRVGRYAFIGGYSVVTKDALPYAKTVGDRARIYGLNSIGLSRRGFTPEAMRALKRAFRYLLVSKLTPARALEAIEAESDLQCAEVDYLVDFIRTSRRGVTLKRASQRSGEDDDE